MTTAFDVQGLARTLGEQYPDIRVPAADTLLVAPDVMPEIALYLRDTEGLKFDYVNYITAVDYYQYFEIVYRLTSTEYNHTMTVKVRTAGRDNQSVPSVTGTWQAADFQEREIFDLFGISFEGHPNLQRIFLWEGFEGYPLRKDFTW